MPKEAPRSGYSCAICSRAIWKDTSIQTGIGPICRAKLAAEAEDHIRDSCDGRGCLVHREHALTIIGRLRHWLQTMAEATGEAMPDQARMLLLVRRMEKALDPACHRVEHINPNCTAPEGRPHFRTPEVVNVGAWCLASWLNHQVEPWLWIRHRDICQEASPFYRHVRNLLEVTGAVPEAAEVAKLEARPRRGVKYRKQIYRRLAWYPI